MRKLLAAVGVMGALVMSAPSSAAELGQISGPGATHMWGGFYAGVNAGYGWGSSEWPQLDKNYSDDGWLAGATGGFNIDSGDWIFGFEMDYDWTGMSGSQTGYPFYQSPRYYDQRHVSTDLETLGTARVRAGYDVGDATNPLLLYVTGGLAFGNVKASLHETYCDGETCSTYGGSDRKVQFGWAYGAGAEYAFDNSWSAKLEYLRVDLRDHTYSIPNIEQPPLDVSVGPIDIVRVGLNYHF